MSSREAPRSSECAASSGGTAQPSDKVAMIFFERPKMPRATWDALRTHIQKERLKKKQEQQQSQEVARQKKEREHKKKQEALNLEDTKAEIAKLETALGQLKEEKHQLFSTLKKVLHEDMSRRNKTEAPAVSHPQVYLQTAVRPNPNQHFLNSHPHLLLKPAVQQSQEPLLAVQPPKRKRTPSPQRSTIPPVYYRTLPAPLPSGLKYHHPAMSAVNSVSASVIYGSAVAAAAAAAGLPPSHYQAHYGADPAAAAAAAAAAAKHVYLSQADAASRGGPPATVIVTTGQPPRSSPYVQPSGTAASLAAATAAANRGVTSLPPPAAHGGAGGSILSGYPRTAPTSNLRYQGNPSAPTSASASPRLSHHSLSGSTPTSGAPSPQQQTSSMGKLYQREV